MVEINQETANIIQDGLELLIKFSNIDNSTIIDLECLSLLNYSVADDWLLILMRILFINSSEEVSHCVLDDIDDIVRALESVNDESYIWHYCNFLNEYNYNGCDEEVEDSDEYWEDYLEYFYSLEINVLKLYSPLVCEFNDLDMNNFVNKIPYLIGSYYGIGRRDLLGCVIEKADNNDMNVISIYYFNDDYGDLYANITRQDTYHEFVKAIDLYVDSKRRKGRK